MGIVGTDGSVATRQERAAMKQVVREQIEVDRPPTVIWDHLAKLEQWPSWAGHIKKMDPTPPGELTSETEVVLHMKMGARTRMRVTEYDPPRRWMWEGKGFGTTIRFEHALEPVGEGRTRVWFLAWMGGPLSGPGGWTFGRMMRRYLSAALPALKAEIESASR